MSVSKNGFLIRKIQYQRASRKKLWTIFGLIMKTKLKKKTMQKKTVLSTIGKKLLFLCNMNSHWLLLFCAMINFGIKFLITTINFKSMYFLLLHLCEYKINEKSSSPQNNKTLSQLAIVISYPAGTRRQNDVVWTLIRRQNLKTMS